MHLRMCYTGEESARGCVALCVWGVGGSLNQSIGVSSYQITMGCVLSFKIIFSLSVVVFRFPEICRFFLYLLFHSSSDFNEVYDALHKVNLFLLLPTWQLSFHFINHSLADIMSF